MELLKLSLLALLACTLFSSCLARPYESSDELTNLASELSHTLGELVDLMLVEHRPRRRRRMVQIHMGRQQYRPRLLRRRFRKDRVYRSQRGGRNADISDH